jgi:hypothetical protein
MFLIIFERNNNNILPFISVRSPICRVETNYLFPRKFRQFSTKYTKSERKNFRLYHRTHVQKMRKIMKNWIENNLFLKFVLYSLLSGCCRWGWSCWCARCIPYRESSTSSGPQSCPIMAEKSAPRQQQLSSGNNLLHYFVPGNRSTML